MNTEKISQLPNGTTIDPAKDLIEVSQYNPQTGGYVSIKSPIGLSGGFSSVKFTVNANIITDQAIILTGGTKFIPIDFEATNASINLTTAANLEVWTGPNKSGTQFVNCGPCLGNLTTSSKFVNFLTNGSVTVLGTDTIGAIVYLSLGIPQGVAATFDIYLKYSIVG